MRDPTRIAEMLQEVEKIWRKSPDLRFWQVLHMLQVEYNNGVENSDMFYVEDDKFLDWLRERARQKEKPRPQIKINPDDGVAMKALKELIINQNKNVK